MKYPIPALALALVATLGCGTTDTDANQGVSGPASDGGGFDGTIGSATDTAVSTDTATDTQVSADTCWAAADCLHNCGGANMPVGCALSCQVNTKGRAKSELDALLNCVDAQCVKGKCKGKGDKCVEACVSQRCMGVLLDCIDTGEAGKGTCGELWKCGDGTCNFNDKDPYACWAKCHDAADKANQALFESFAVCVGSAEDQGKPWEQQCMQHWYKCVAGGQQGKGNCADFWSCQGPCKAAGGDDHDCAAKCLPKVSDKAQKQVLEVAICGESKTPASAACKQTYLACAEPDGTKSCGDVYACAEACGKGAKSQDAGFGCALGCMNKGSAVAATAYMELLACTVWSPVAGCLDQLVTCAAPSGSGGCTALQKCVEACNSKTGQAKTGCVFGCFSKSTKPATDAWLKMATCWDGCNKECGTKGKACVDTCAASKCAAVYATCAKT